MCSLFAACRDLANAPCDQAVRDVLARSLPKRPRTLEEWLAPALNGQYLPQALFRRAREIAIDCHLIPYHGKPKKHANELYHGKPKSGTTKFHLYATACVTEAGFRYTLAATYLKGNESTVDGLQRLLARVKERGVSIKVLLLDRQYFATPVIEFLQSQRIPFLVPLALRGRKPKRRQSKPGQRRKTKTAMKLRDFARQKAGTYRYTWTVKKISVTFNVVVAYKSFRHHETDQRKSKKLLYAAWRVSGDPVWIRELYRHRFAIESTYRQLRQARIYTCTTDPVMRLFFVLVALILRNAWVLLHYLYFAEREGGTIRLHLNRLRFRRMLNWIDNVITNKLHDGSSYTSQTAFA
jgi:hypothetical protein